MKSLTTIPNPLALGFTRQIIRDRSFLTYLVRVAQEAVDAEGEVYTYAVFKAIAALTEAQLWKEAAKGVVTDHDAWFAERTLSLLDDVAGICDRFSAHLLQVLDEVSRDSEPVGLAEEVRNLLQRRLRG